MSWFLISLIPPFLWSVTNYIDKYLIDNHSHKNGIGSLVLFSSFIGVLVVPIILIINPQVLDISLKDIFILLSVGITGVLWVIFYLYALNIDETTIVVPLFQSIPVIGFILGYLILNETLSTNQIIGSLIIVMGGFILSLNIENNNGLSFKWKTFTLMIISSFFVALNEILFKLVTVPDEFLVSTFWTYLGYILIGLILYTLIKDYRISFNKSITKSTKSFLSLNITNEIINTIADTVMRFAILLAPIAIVQSINSFQPLYILIIGIVLTKLFPNINKQKIDKKSLIQRSFSILLIIIGGIIIS